MDMTKRNSSMFTLNIMSEEGGDETCDQTGPNSGQVSFIQLVETKPFSN